MEYYKNKCEELLKSSEKKNELEKLNESLMNKLNDNEKKFEFLESKISKYKERISEEKNKIITYEVLQSKKTHEIEILKQDNQDLEMKLHKLETELIEKSQQLDRIQNDQIYKDSFNNLGSELSEFIQIVESQNALHKLERKKSIPSASVQKELNDDEFEMIQKENTVLIERLKESGRQTEFYKNENEKLSKNQANIIEQWNKEKEFLQNEINRMKIITSDMANKEFVHENKKLKDEFINMKKVYFFLSFICKIYLYL